LKEKTNDNNILVVDDEHAILRILDQLLTRNGYEPATADCGQAAREALRSRQFALVLCDINMPGESGLDLVAYIKSEFPQTAVVMVSAIDDPKVADQAMELGVYGYIIKPFELNEVLINTANALRRRQLEIASSEYQERLETEVQTRTVELRTTLARLRSTLDQLEKASLDTIVRLSRAGEYKDQDTGAHILRMSHYASALAGRIGLGERTAQLILYASPMHDIGKIGIPDHILLKPGALDPVEWEIMKTHTEIGANILNGAKTGFLRLAETIAATHHEKWDGSGYPRGLKGKAIPLAGQIVAVADVFDALCSERPYKPAFPLEKTYRIIEEGRGVHFRPDLVDAFMDVREEIEELRDRYRDDHFREQISLESIAQ
jgi:putative two-component system response regulator